MDQTKKHDGDRIIDWSKTSVDYAKFRPGPPPSFYEKLKQIGIGHKGQRVLDLGTGTGVLARQFAEQGATVAGIDIAEGQIEQAKCFAKERGLDIDFRTSSVEYLPFEDNSFDAVTANQCWLYFDESKLIPALKRVLKPGGVISISGNSWLPNESPIAKQSEGLILEFNPDWTAHSWPGAVPIHPGWTRNGRGEPVGRFSYVEQIHFTHETWVGRMVASRGIGATLEPYQVNEFARRLDELLKKEGTPDPFEVAHGISAHVYRLS